MIKLGKVFDRFPQLTSDQRNELARRRAVRAFELIPDKETVTMPGQFQKLIGAPVSIIFNESLSKETFDYWIKSTFGRVNNRFRLWGNPIILGPKKVHVYGVDKHLWKPIFLELTDKHLIAIVPKGTCGNTIHRLICNIQRYIDPAAKVYIGDMEYGENITHTEDGITESPDNVTTERPGNVTG